MQIFLPGPTQVRDKYLNAMHHHMVGHRGKEYGTLHKDVVDLLREVFRAHDYHIYISTSSSSLVMEGAVRNCVQRKVLHTINGAFSERWIEMSQANGKKTYRIDVPWGESIIPDMLHNFLAHHNPEAVCLTHCESSTGVLLPLTNIISTIRKQSDALIFVDAVSSGGGVDIDLEKNPIDVLIFGTQKCMALPPGLSFAFVSPRAYQKSALVEDAGYYTRYQILEKFAQRNQTPATPNISLMYALLEKLKDMKKEGMKAREARHRAMQNEVYQWMKKHNLNYFSHKRYASPTMSVIQNKLGIKSDILCNELQREGFLIAPGYSALRNMTFRIGHMGDHTVAEVKKLLRTMDIILERHKK